MPRCAAFGAAFGKIAAAIALAIQVMASRAMLAEHLQAGFDCRRTVVERGGLSRSCQRRKDQQNRESQVFESHAGIISNHGAGSRGKPGQQPFAYSSASRCGWLSAASWGKGDAVDGESKPTLM